MQSSGEGGRGEGSATSGAHLFKAPVSERRPSSRRDPPVRHKAFGRVGQRWGRAAAEAAAPRGTHERCARALSPPRPPPTPRSAAPRLVASRRVPWSAADRRHAARGTLWESLGSTRQIGGCRRPRRECRDRGDRRVLPAESAIGRESCRAGWSAGPARRHAHWPCMPLAACAPMGRVVACAAVAISGCGSGALSAGSPNSWAGWLALRHRGPIRPRWSGTLRGACVATRIPFPESE